MIPWLAKPDQSKVFPNNTTFETPEQQEEVRARSCCAEGGVAVGGPPWPAWLGRGGAARAPACAMWPGAPPPAPSHPTPHPAQYVRDWVKKRTGFDSDFKVTFYPGRYAPEKCSILPVGDPTQYVPDHEVRVAAMVCTGGGGRRGLAWRGAYVGGSGGPAAAPPPGHLMHTRHAHPRACLHLCPPPPAGGRGYP